MYRMADVSCDDFPVERVVLAGRASGKWKCRFIFNNLQLFCIFMKSSVDGLKVWAYNPAIERERRRFWRPTNSL
ncbi:hypothetical protein [Shinella sp. WSJ-2]|uniref:hypothetical protein n=1 Tax=Shinella sp. WSJ-2 TaxID=2303749 RepID=UPI0011C0E5DB|nr:hypothetical protein [Shinella sp. WSJ-2]